MIARVRLLPSEHAHLKLDRRFARILEPERGRALRRLYRRIDRPDQNRTRLGDRRPGQDRAERREQPGNRNDMMSHRSFPPIKTHQLNVTVSVSA